MGAEHMSLRTSAAIARTILFSCVLLSPCAQGAGEDQPTGRELAILNWTDYVDPALVDEFEAKFRVTVREIYFGSDDAREEMLIDTGGSGYDIVIVNGVNLEVYKRRGWLAPLRQDDVPNLKFVDTRWLDAFPASHGYAVPYFWGTLGIAYRKDLVTEPISKWMQLFRPPEQLRGKIGMISSSRDAIGMALKALGYSANSTDRDELREAEQLLLAQRPYVRSYTYPALTEESGLVSGDIAAAMLFSGDALMLKQHHSTIEYVAPAEGGCLWVDYLVVMQSSSNKVLAKSFINFLNEPDNAKRLAEYVYYASPNTAAEQLLAEAFLNDSVIYPSSEIMEKSESYTTLPPRAERMRNMIITRVIQ